MGPIVKHTVPGDARLRVVVLTSNPFKEREYKSELAEAYGLNLTCKKPPETLTDDALKAIFAEMAASPHFIIREESQLLNAVSGEVLSGLDIVAHPEKAPDLVRNRARVTVWIPNWEKEQFTHFTKQEYSHEIKGYIDPKRMHQLTREVFGWDHLFVNPQTGRSNLDALQSVWGKNSARQLVLGDFIQNHLFYQKPQALSFHRELQPKQGVDFSKEMSVWQFMKNNRYLTNPYLSVWGLDRLQDAILDEGVFFKSATSRPIKNYFSPPFGGVPLTSKKSDVEETVFMMHDLNHHNIPDLIFDGDGSGEMRYVYVIWRMMSEAMTLVIADMLYADTLVRMDVANKSKVDQRIYPLFEALALGVPSQKVVTELLWANTLYAILGDDSAWKKLLKSGQEEKLQAYKNHFEKFFIGDHVWTKANFTNMAAMKEQYVGWIDMVGKENFAKSGLLLLGDVAAKIAARGANLSSMRSVVRYVFDEIIETRIFPKRSETPPPITDDERLSRGFRRYMIGQMSFYAHFSDLTGMNSRMQAMAKKIKEASEFDEAGRNALVQQFKDDVRFVWGMGVITSATASNYMQIHPIFPPVYINYTRQESKSVREVLYHLYKETDPKVRYVNTSNPGKLQEYMRSMQPLEVVGLKTDLAEPEADILTIVHYKASQFENVLVDDVSLDIEGCDVGVNVRWNLEAIKAGEFTGKKCVYRCYVAIAKDGKVHIYKAETPGVLVEKRGDCFGFGSYFLPDGSDKTLGEYMDPKYNARDVALDRYKNDLAFVTTDLLPVWNGPFQAVKS